jgi:hypothetical protein
VKYDDTDLEELDVTVRSPGFRLIRECLARVREAKVRELIAPATPEKTAELRGAIAALDTTLRVGEDLRKDIAAKLRKAAKVD